jgi:hypothetical protein
MHALAAVEHPAVRAFALELLRRGHRLDNAFGLFEWNYLPGDHLAIMDALTAHQMDRETLHGAGLDLRKVFEDRETAECRDVLMWVYENTPCSLCRGEAVKILAASKCLPEAVIRECLDDCSVETRAFAIETLSRRGEST